MLVCAGIPFQIRPSSGVSWITVRGKQPSGHTTRSSAATQDVSNRKLQPELLPPLLCIRRRGCNAVVDWTYWSAIGGPMERKPTSREFGGAKGISHQECRGLTPELIPPTPSFSREVCLTRPAPFRPVLLR